MFKSSSTKALFLGLLVLFLVAPAVAEKRVFFSNLQDGQEVSNPIKIDFGIKGMEVKPAGDVAKGTGHHHLIINGKFVKRGVVIPADDTHLHFGKGQTETELSLPKGEHLLTLQFADGAHKSYGKRLANTIKINVTD